MKSIFGMARAFALALALGGAAAWADVGTPQRVNVNVRVDEECEGMGTVSGGGRVREGSKVTIKATAKKGHAFEGWYDEYEGELVSHSASYSFRAYQYCSFVARFIPASDDWLWVDGSDRDFEVGEFVSEGEFQGELFSVDSGSAPTIKISGLPAGVKYDAASQTISGRVVKRGVYYVTCSAQNGNGYKMSSTAVWNVGNAPNGDYDGIGLEYWFDVEELENLQVGVPADMCTNMKSVSGLPTGLKFVSQNCRDGVCTACGGFVRGTPTKAGAFKITFTDHDGAKAVKTVVVRDGTPGYLDVAVGGGGWRGTATGGGVFSAGATVKLSAKPSGGCIFAGWYDDEEFESPFYGLSDWRKASGSFVFSEEMANTTLYARFIEKHEDYISIDGDDSWNVNDSYGYEYYVDSETLPSETVKGLPAGVKWDKEGRYLYVDDVLKLKPGTTVATITAKNLSGQTDTKQVRIVVPNLQSWVFSGLDYSDKAYNRYVGVSDVCELWCYFDYDESYKITASGLPPGLSLYQNFGVASVSGTPSKAGTYTVTLTAKKGSYTEKATFTINVGTLPDYAVGTYNGILKDDGGDIVGTFTFTAAANGKLSAKVNTAAGSLSLSSPAWECYSENLEGGGLRAYFYKESANEDVSFALTFADGFTWNCDDQIMGGFSWEKSGRNGAVYIYADVAAAQRSPFAKPLGEGSWEAAYVAENIYSEYSTRNMAVIWDDDLAAYRIECVYCVVPGREEGFATLKMGRNGTATLSGSLNFTSTFSASATLFFDTACGEYDDLYGEHCYAVFAPVVKIRECGINSSGRVSCTMSQEGTLIPIYWFPWLSSY